MNIYDYLIKGGIIGFCCSIVMLSSDINIFNDKLTRLSGNYILHIIIGNIIGRLISTNYNIIVIFNIKAIIFGFLNCYYDRYLISSAFCSNFGYFTLYAYFGIIIGASVFYLEKLIHIFIKID